MMEESITAAIALSSNIVDGGVDMKPENMPRMFLFAFCVLTVRKTR